MEKIFLTLTGIITLFILHVKINNINETTYVFLILLTLLFLWLFFGYACYYKYRKKSGFDNSKINISNIIIRETLIGFFLGSIATFFSFLLFLSIREVEFFPARFSYLLLTYAFVFSLGAAVFEEVVFRGILQGILHRIFKRKLYAPVVIFPVACLFTYTHIKYYSDFFHLRIILVALSGLIFGIMTYKTKALWLSMGAHFSWNFFQIIAFGYEQRRFEMQLGFFNSTDDFRQYAIIVLFISIVIWSTIEIYKIFKKISIEKALLHK